MNSFGSKTLLSPNLMMFQAYFNSFAHQDRNWPQY